MLRMPLHEGSIFSLPMLPMKDVGGSVGGFATMPGGSKPDASARRYPVSVPADPAVRARVALHGTLLDEVEAERGAATRQGRRTPLLPETPKTEKAREKNLLQFNKGRFFSKLLRRRGHRAAAGRPAGRR